MFNSSEGASTPHCDADFYVINGRSLPVTTFYFQHILGTEISIPETLLNIRDFSSVRLPLLKVSRVTDILET
jgi:hypothetical protein